MASPQAVPNSRDLDFSISAHVTPVSGSECPSSRSCTPGTVSQEYSVDGIIQLLGFGFTPVVDRETGDFVTEKVRRVTQAVTLTIHVLSRPVNELNYFPSQTILMRWC